MYKSACCTRGNTVSEKGCTIYIDFISLTKLQRTGRINDLKQICSRHNTSSDISFTQ